MFYNRLNNFGDPNYGFLQSDATTAYELGHDPTPEDIKNPTPFNTYTNTGLPPTPICSPGLDCLQAVCNPAQTNSSSSTSRLMKAVRCSTTSAKRTKSISRRSPSR